MFGSMTIKFIFEQEKTMVIEINLLQSCLKLLEAHAFYHI